MTSRGTSEFWRLYRRLPPRTRAEARLAYRKFARNPAQPGLHLERLRFDVRAWSVRITRDYRAVARRYGDDWLWIWIGAHRDFDLRFPR